MPQLPKTVSVGIMTAPSITIFFNGRWMVRDWHLIENTELTTDVPCSFCPIGPESSFTLKAVTIGKEYHWERKEDQTFTGKLNIISEGKELTAINILPIENYLLSVISSEMSATAGLEFLKASAVISRSWVTNMIMRAKTKENTPETTRGENSDTRFITWFDHQDHMLYDVCADDHCQRYQGITKASNPNVRKAIEATRGQVLTYDGKVCDCRFSKCCGGRMEEFATCWEEKQFPYLQPHEDRDPKDGTIFCDTRDKNILSQVLNNYDQETTDFYQWQVEYTQAELSELICRKLGRDFGNITELRPIKRGASGRICELLIRGTKQELTIGKELIIRSALSESHLYSSAFEVETVGSGQLPDRFILHGKGWGHGVGMCQIGAAVMAEKGYSYQDILLHYYPGTTIETKIKT